MNAHDEDLRTALHHAVDDLHPLRGFDEIRDEVDATAPSRRRWAPLVVAVAAAVALVTGGTALLAQQLKESSRSEGTAAGAPTADPTPRDADVTVYYVSDTPAGPRLFSERRHLTGVSGSDLQVAVEAAATLAPLDNDYYPFPTGDGLTVRTTRDADSVTIDLRDYQQPADAGSGEDQQMALQALVWTADAATGDRLPVRFLLDGRSGADEAVLSRLTGERVDPMPADDALALVSIASPTEGAEVGSTFEVSGRASANEANVSWQLKQAGRTVKAGFTTAAECCTLSPYSFTVEGVPAGRYTLVVGNTDESDGEGLGPDQDTKEIMVR